MFEGDLNSGYVHVVTCCNLLFAETAPLAFDVDLRYGGSEATAPGGFIYGKPASAIPGHPDVCLFSLHDDPAHQLFLSPRLAPERSNWTAVLSDVNHVSWTPSPMI